MLSPHAILAFGSRESLGHEVNNNKCDHFQELGTVLSALHILISDNKLLR